MFSSTPLQNRLLPCSSDFASVLHQRLSGWVQEFLPYHALMRCTCGNGDSTNEVQSSRALDDSTRSAANWRTTFLGVEGAVGNFDRLGTGEAGVQFLSWDLLPTGDGWPSGLLSKTPVRNMTKDEKDALTSEQRTTCLRSVHTLSLSRWNPHSVAGTFSLFAQSDGRF